MCVLLYGCKQVVRCFYGGGREALCVCLCSEVKVRLSGLLSVPGVNRVLGRLGCVLLFRVVCQ